MQVEGKRIGMSHKRASTGTIENTANVFGDTISPRRTSDVDVFSKQVISPNRPTEFLPFRPQQREEKVSPMRRSSHSNIGYSRPDDWLSPASRKSPKTYTVRRELTNDEVFKMDKARESQNQGQPNNTDTKAVEVLLPSAPDLESSFSSLNTDSEMFSIKEDEVEQASSLNTEQEDPAEKSNAETAGNPGNEVIIASKDNDLKGSRHKRTAGIPHKRSSTGSIESKAKMFGSTVSPRRISDIHDISNHMTSPNRPTEFLPLIPKRRQDKVSPMRRSSHSEVGYSRPDEWLSPGTKARKSPKTYTVRRELTNEEVLEMDKARELEIENTTSKIPTKMNNIVLPSAPDLESSFSSLKMDEGILPTKQHEAKGERATIDSNIKKIAGKMISQEEDSKCNDSSATISTEGTEETEEESVCKQKAAIFQNLSDLMTDSAKQEDKLSQSMDDNSSVQSSGSSSDESIDVDLSKPNRFRVSQLLVKSMSDRALVDGSKTAGSGARGSKSSETYFSPRRKKLLVKSVSDRGLMNGMDDKKLMTKTTGCFSPRKSESNADALNAQSPKPLMDLRHILKKYEKTPEKVTSKVKNEVTFYGSMPPFLQAQLETGKKHKGKTTKKKMAKRNSKRHGKGEKKSTSQTKNDSDLSSQDEHQATQEKEKTAASQGERHSVSYLGTDGEEKQVEITVTKEYTEDQLKLWKAMIAQDTDSSGRKVSERPAEMLPLEPQSSTRMKEKRPSSNIREIGYNRPDEWLNPDLKTPEKVSYTLKADVKNNGVIAE